MRGKRGILKNIVNVVAKYGNSLSKNINIIKLWGIFLFCLIFISSLLPPSLVLLIELSIAIFYIFLPIGRDVQVIWTWPISMANSYCPRWDSESKWLCSFSTDAVTNYTILIA